MAIDLAVMRKRLEEKQAEIQQHIATLTGSPAPPEDAIQASDGVVEPEEEAVDLQETDVEQALLDNEKALRAEVQRIAGIALPGAANTTSRSEGVIAMWLGPQSWLLVAADAAALGDFTGARDALNAAGGALFDVSASRGAPRRKIHAGLTLL